MSLQEMGIVELVQSTDPDRDKELRRRFWRAEARDALAAVGIDNPTTAMLDSVAKRLAQAQFVEIEHEQRLMEES